MEKPESAVLFGLPTFYKAVLRSVRPHMSSEATVAAAAHAAKAASAYAHSHPYHAFFLIFNISLAPWFGFSWLTKSLLGAIGFGPLGPVTNTLATWYQASYLGAYIPAGSLFSLLQKLAMTA